MDARRAIERAAFGPQALHVMGQAFDEAWDEVAWAFDNKIAQEAARLVLANGILTVATNASRDVEELKQAALRALAVEYPAVRPRSDPAKWV